MTLQQLEQLPYIPFNDLGCEVIPRLQHLGRTNIQTRFDTSKSEAGLLPLRVLRQMYTTLEVKRDQTDLFYTDTHKGMGLSKDAINEHVHRLWDDMNTYGLWADELLVVADPKELIFNSYLEYRRLPAILQGTSVEIRGSENLRIADEKHGMTTDEFIKAGGKFFGGSVLAYLNQNSSLMETHDVAQDLEILGLRKGDDYRTNLGPEHSYGIKSFRAVLCPSGERSRVDSGAGLEGWVDDRGAFVGRKLSADDTFYKSKLSQLHAKVRNIEQEIEAMIQ